MAKEEGEACWAGLRLLRLPATAGAMKEDTTVGEMGELGWAGLLLGGSHGAMERRIGIPFASAIRMIWS